MCKTGVASLSWLYVSGQFNADDRCASMSKRIGSRLLNSGTPPSRRLVQPQRLRNASRGLRGCQRVVFPSHCISDFSRLTAARSVQSLPAMHGSGTENDRYKILSTPPWCEHRPDTVLLLL